MAEFQAGNVEAAKVAFDEAKSFMPTTNGPLTPLCECWETEMNALMTVNS